MNCGARPLEKTEIEKLLAAFAGPSRARDRAMVQTGLYTGMRLGSVLALRIGDVWDGRRFRPRVRVARKHLKGRHAGVDLPLHPAARCAIGRWLVTLRRRGVTLRADLPLFLSREGSGGRALSRRRAQEIVQDAAAKAGLGYGVSTHSWRKTFAGRLYEATNHNILLVSRALHHRQISTSIHYLGWKLEERADAAILAL